MALIPPEGVHSSRQRGILMKRAGATVLSIALAQGLFLLPGLVAPAAAAPEVDEATYFIDEGHVDAFYFNHNDGVPYLALKDDSVSPYEIRDPQDVELHAKEAALTNLPAVGAVPEELHNREVYHLPLTQDHNLLWPGWESQPLQSAGYNQVDINITDVEGPGDAYLWSVGSFGASVVPLLNDGRLKFPGTIHQSFLAHTHAHWAFTEPGDYVFTVSGEVHNSSTGANDSTETKEYLFSVGSFTRTPETVSVAGATDYETGDAVELVAEPEKAAVNVPRLDNGEWDVVDPEWTWESRVAGGDWSSVEGQNSETYRGVAHADGEELRAVAIYDDEAQGRAIEVVSEPVELNVIDIAPEISIVPLNDQYRQGDDIVLELDAEPELSGQDEVRWQWRLPGANWSDIPAASSHSHTVRAEQALNGVPVRAQVTYAESGETLTSEPATIAVDDGAEAEQMLSISGVEDQYETGDTATLELNVDPATALQTFQWFIDAGDGEAEPIEGATSRRLELPLTEDHDGSQIRAAVVHANGEIAYGLSAAVTLNVSADSPGDPDPTPDPTDEPTDDPTPDPTDEPTPDPTPTDEPTDTPDPDDTPTPDPTPSDQPSNGGPSNGPSPNPSGGSDPSGDGNDGPGNGGTDDRRGADQKNAPGAGNGSDPNVPKQAGAAGYDGPLPLTGADNRILLTLGLTLLTAGTGAGILVIKRRGAGE
ncbi:choice-of-anchor M domain-containing protein [Actinomycetaceae bacterium L2_0104]